MQKQIIAILGLTVAAGYIVVSGDDATCLYPENPDGTVKPGRWSCEFSMSFPSCDVAKERLRWTHDRELVDAWKCDEDCSACRVRASVKAGDLSEVRSCLDGGL